MMTRTAQTTIVIIIVVLVVLGLASIKVDNELKMTKAYDRQAAALERIADDLNQFSGNTKPSSAPIKKLRKCLEYRDGMWLGIDLESGCSR